MNPADLLATASSINPTNAPVGLRNAACHPARTSNPFTARVGLRSAGCQPAFTSITLDPPNSLAACATTLARYLGAPRALCFLLLLPFFLLPFLLAPGAAAAAAAAAAPLRNTISLDGNWQIAEAAAGIEPQPAPPAPAAFNRIVPVPGLVDMARPAFDDVAPPVADRRQLQQKDPKRDAFWYRRVFTLDASAPLPPSAILKIGKAMFGTRVFINGKNLGDHAPCFTPAFFDARAALKPGENEIVIRVGADRDAIRPAVPDGFDFEKTRYIPGIFDSVQLILSGTPRIANAQVAPDIAGSRAKIRVYTDAAAGEAQADVSIEIREWKSRRAVASASGRLAASGETDFVLPIENARLWSPDDPFLYEATIRTSGDEFTTRFGMREFHFDKKTGKPFLNGKLHYLRGSNITLYRFFEDSQRGALPWDADWVRLLHRRARDMHWEMFRYCIGFPPEFWYDIADEEGILIQDEFPIWYLSKNWPPELKASQLAAEYADWMRERWNHPCVIIWDASNETESTQTAPAIEQVRALDLSARPWDNSWSPDFRPGDVMEVHPYHFGAHPAGADYRISNLAIADPAPWDHPAPWELKHGERGERGVIINEYGWLWLNRDGTPTTLTEKLYRNLLGPDSTAAQRFHLYARYLAAETEFWRSHRAAAAVLHFTMLGYDRPDGQTSDHWRDVQNLVWEPEFYRYVRDAFAPVGVMLDAWAETYPAGLTRDFPCVLINDTAHRTRRAPRGFARAAPALWRRRLRGGPARKRAGALARTCASPKSAQWLEHARAL